MTQYTDGTILTSWAVKLFETLGNEEDGFEVNDVYTKGEVVLELVVQIHNIGTSRQFLGAYPTSEDGQNIFGCDVTVDECTSNGEHVYFKCTETGEPIGMIECYRDDLTSIKVTTHDEIYTALAFMTQSEDMPELDGGSGEYDPHFGGVLKSKMSADSKEMLNSELDRCDVEYWLDVLDIDILKFCIDYVGTRNGDGVGFWDYNGEAAELEKFVKAQGTLDLYIGDDGEYYL